MQTDSGKSYDDINVTPMVDLYLVLLLIFIIMTTAGVQGVKVNLPKGSKSAPTLSAPKSQAITINNEGKVFLNTIPVTLAELQTKLEAHKAANPEFPVIIRGDNATQYQSIMEVLNVVGALGISQVGLATQASKK